MDNKLPKDWKIVKVGKYVISTKGKKPKRISNVKTNECNLPYVNIKAFEKGIIDEYTDGIGCVICEEGDFLMVWDGSRSGYVGKAIKGALGSTLVRLNFPDLDNNYAYYFLQSKYIEINTRAKGVGIPHVDPNLLWNYELLIPPIETQQAIVSKIEELFSELDKGIEDLKTAQQQLKTYRQSVLKWAFEGKLTNENVKDGELPKNWEMSTIGNIFEVHIGSTPKRNVSEYWGGNINWVSSGEIAFCNITKTKEQITKIGLENTSCKVHPVGTVIIAMIGEGKTRGQAAILKIEASHNQNTAAIRVDNKTYLSELLYYYLFLKYQDNRKVGSGNNQKALNKERVKKIEIPLPPLEEQHLIVQEIESRLSVADKMEESIAQSLQQAEALRQSILKKAFSGELV